MVRRVDSDLGSNTPTEAQITPPARIDETTTTDATLDLSSADEQDIQIHTTTPPPPPYDGIMDTKNTTKQDSDVPQIQNAAAEILAGHINDSASLSGLFHNERSRKIRHQ